MRRLRGRNLVRYSPKRKSFIHKRTNRRVRNMNFNPFAGYH